MSSPEQLEWLTLSTARLLTASLDEDREQEADVLSEIADELGLPGIYAMCCALAATVQRVAFPGVKQGDGSLTGGLAVVHRVPGGKDDPDHLWAAQFLTTYLNGDRATNAALFNSTLHDADAHCGGVGALISMATTVVRPVRDQTPF